MANSTRGDAPSQAPRGTPATLFEPTSLPAFLATAWPDAVWTADPEPARLTALGAPELFDVSRLVATYRGDAKVLLPGDDGQELHLELPAARLLPLLAAGGSILLFGADAHIPVLSAWVADLDRAFGLRPGSFRASVHISPAGGGTALHFDPYEILVLQLVGAKQWSIGEVPACKWPSLGHLAGSPVVDALRGEWDADAGPPAPTREVTLEPGAMLFLPRGHWHQTRAAGMSVSVSFQMVGPTWLDLALQAVRRRLARVPAWRQPAFGGHGGDDHPTTRAAQAAIEALLDGWPAPLAGVTAGDLLGSTSRGVHDIPGLMAALRATFRPEAAGTTGARYQFRVTDDDSKSFVVVVDGGRIEVTPGVDPSPTLTIACGEREMLLLVADTAAASELLNAGRLEFHPFDLGALGAMIGMFSLFGSADE